jgi:hypothetical protein
VLQANVADPTVAQLLANLGQQMARQGDETATGSASSQPPPAVTVIDVVATSASDPRGLVLALVQLPLVIGGVITAAAIALVLRFRPAWRQFLALVVVSASAGLGAYLIGQGFLGGLPHEHVATWASLALTLLAVGSTAAGFIALIGAGGLGLSAAVLVLAGNAFSAAATAPQLVPTAIGHIGQWLPAGAGNNLIRSTAYFNGHGAAGHLIVLITWSVLGLAAIVVGHHPVRLAASRPQHSASQPQHSASQPQHGASQPQHGTSQPQHSAGPYHGLHATAD